MQMAALAYTDEYKRTGADRSRTSSLCEIQLKRCSSAGHNGGRESAWAPIPRPMNLESAGRAESLSPSLSLSLSRSMDISRCLLRKRKAILGVPGKGDSLGFRKRRRDRDGAYQRSHWLLPGLSGPIQRGRKVIPGTMRAPAHIRALPIRPPLAPRAAYRRSRESLPARRLRFASSVGRRVVGVFRAGGGEGRILLRRIESQSLGLGVLRARGKARRRRGTTRSPGPRDSAPTFSFY
jgi:hypothetical protein